MVDEIAAYGATAILANAGGMVAWYPTRLPYQRSNPYLRTDFLREITDAARARGIRVLARLDITKGYAEDLARHPDRFRVAADGQPVLVRELAETCFNGAYWQQFNFEILDEILTGYPVDGIFYNHYRYLTCYCPRCRERFRAAAGFAMPVTEDWADEAWRALVRYRYQALADYTLRVRAHVRRLRPEALVAWDYELATDNPAYARDSGWGPTLTALSDVIVSIAFDRLTRPLPKWIYQSGEQASLGRASFRRPTCVVLTYSAIFGNRRHAQDDRKALPAIEQTYRVLDRHQDVYRGLTSAAEVALIYSERTADWYGYSDPFYRYLAHYRGCYEVLVHEHFPFDVVEHEHLIDLLHAYRLVILPNVACISDETARAIDGFVKGGGHLIATHETALYDHEGRPRKDFALGSLGRRFVKRRVMQGTYLLVKDRHLLGPTFRDTDLIGLGLERPYGGFGPFLPVVDVDQPGGEGEFIFTEGEEQIADLLLSNPVTNNVPEFSYWEGEIGTPGLTINRFGGGTAAYLPWGVGRFYHLYGVIECRHLIGRLVERALGSRPIHTDAPISVETVLSRSGTRTILHLINSTGVESKPLLEPVPVGPVTVAIRGSATSARALIDGRPLQITRDGGHARFVIPRVGAFEVVVLG